MGLFGGTACEDTYEDGRHLTILGRSELEMIRARCAQRVWQDGFETKMRRALTTGGVTAVEVGAEIDRDANGGVLERENGREETREGGGGGAMSVRAPPTPTAGGVSHLHLDMLLTEATLPSAAGVFQGKTPLASADAHITALVELGHALSAARRAVLQGDLDALESALQDAEKAQQSCADAAVTVPETVEEELSALRAYVRYQYLMASLRAALSTGGATGTPDAIDASPITVDHLDAALRDAEAADRGSDANDVTE